MFFALKIPCTCLSSQAYTLLPFSQLGFRQTNPHPSIYSLLNLHLLPLLNPPDGGRLQQELQYVEETLGKGAGSTKQLLIQTAKEGPGVSLLNSEALLTHLAVLQASVDVTVDLYDT